MYVVLSFDDGRKDNYDVALPILKKYQLTATFNIATAYVDGSISEEDSPCYNEAMSIGDVKKTYSDGYEIACHGDHHRNDVDDIKNGYSKLRSWLGWDVNYKPGFSSPDSNLGAAGIHANINMYKDLFSYIRIASYEKEKLVNRIIRKIAHISGSCVLYDIAYRDNLGGIKDGFVAASVPIVHNVTTEQIESIIIQARKMGKNCILMFHSILPKGAQYYDDLWSWDADKFDSLCSWLNKAQKEGIIDVVRSIDLV